MRTAHGKSLVLAAALAALGACTATDGSLHQLDAPGGGPDEFSIMPQRPLQLPATTALPPPTPGGRNRADIAPLSDAVVAMNGNPGAAVAGGVPARDAALVAAVSQGGVTADIRQVVANEDAAFRGRASYLQAFNLFGSDLYYRAYRSQALDAYAELERFRAAGITVPTAPPAGN
ncbi:DUF3035 domain-containing protein [Wenxinia marina]|uniref:Beta-barrel assembly machine subunit BamF n=1 Tax=Wenxinia marina DSM 24838 TaxID=1123501 RepID=A0A0D0NRG5_9RHOB|nr:DUF3035 domain-containing protein [Wenxinia marina]KIQ70810.1 Beta-barrel assembly machine subunit BamF [Wenxinia marina DSM 24838]GGL57134.1 hypothetical protein GCM10011392_09490 [Wenxinia marina]